MADDKRGTERESQRPISTGPNARPRDETIDQAGGGEPDDSSRAVEITPEEEKAIADRILNR